jgi:hypothetical protein
MQYCSVADSIKGNLYCLARELAFWWCGRVSLLITQVKLQRAWSAPEWVTDIHYKWWQRSDAGVWKRPVSGRASVELWAFVTMMGWGFIQIQKWFRPGTTVVVVMNGGCRCWAGAKHPERTHVNLQGEASLRRKKCGRQYKREFILPCHRASFSGDAVECLVKQRRTWSVLGWVTATCYSRFVTFISTNWDKIVMSRSSFSCENQNPKNGQNTNICKTYGPLLTSFML